MRKIRENPMTVLRSIIGVAKVQQSPDNKKMKMRLCNL
jgi:hypothetical protein